MKIGLSLSFCVQDILDGKVAEQDVLCIVSGTKAATQEDWAKLLQGYEIYWHKNVGEAYNIAVRLRESGRIVQPRLNGQEPPNIAASLGHWLDLSNRYSQSDY